MEIGALRALLTYCLLPQCKLNYPYTLNCPLLVIDICINKPADHSSESLPYDFLEVGFITF